MGSANSSHEIGGISKKMSDLICMGRRLFKIFFSFYKDKFCPDLTYLLRYDILQQFATYLQRYDILQQYMTYLPHVRTVGTFRVLFAC